jgi:hypothetical protein
MAIGSRIAGQGAIQSSEVGVARGWFALARAAKHFAPVNFGGDATDLDLSDALTTKEAGPADA